jgi:4-guanidinobutyraldehyde dehydrogenase/NAD-dependent aldehyde dehydrogenase
MMRLDIDAIERCTLEMNMDQLLNTDWRENFKDLSVDLSPFIDGQRRTSVSTEVFRKISPATGQLLYELPVGHAEDVNLAVSAARGAFDDKRWAGLSLARRKSILMDFADLVEANASELALMDTVEVGKPISDSINIDLPLALGVIRYCAESVDKVMGDSSFIDHTTLAMVARKPRGVIGASIGWNFPTILAAQKIAPALAMGNTIVLKPSELSNLSALRLAELATDAGIPAGVLNVVPGVGATVGEELSRHHDIDMITFTGSSLTGKRIMQAAGASNMKRLLLECGGKSANLVFPDMNDLDAVADGVMARMFWNQGQVCTAGTRLIVHTSIKTELVRKLKNRMGRFKMGDPLDPSTNFGPLVSEAQMNKVLRYIAIGDEEGAKRTHGGQRSMVASGGFFVEPTIFDEVTERMVIAREEIFGPVLSVMSFETVDQAMRLANSTDYGLSASVWTRDLSIIHEAMRSLRVGEITVNACNNPSGGAMFGMLPLEGHKQSGFGGESGLQGLLPYTVMTSVQIHTTRH